TVRPMTIIQLLSAIISAYAISHIIQRAKQCLDFTCTFHFWHLVLTSFYNGFIPTSITWWLLQLVSIIVCTVLGEYWCMKKETLDIPLSIPSSKNDA
uniref:Uncharacterized protein n=1 Tax=Acrobeloides nanus TaxID=290746 RepID=A0A914DG55_9BILA